jgi:hypothetical protein
MVSKSPNVVCTDHTRLFWIVVVCAIAKLAGPTSLAGTDLGPWARVSDYPLDGFQYSPVAHDGRIYVVGGHSGVHGFDSANYVSANADGSLGSWTAATALSGPDQGPGGAVIGNRLYIAGMNSSTGFQSAPINADGSLGAWRTETEPADGWMWSRLGLASHNTRLYLFGGAWPNSSTMSDAVYVASPDANGRVTAWTPTEAMPEGRGHVSVHFFDGRAYIAGGITSGLTILDSAYSAPVNSDGSLGEWRPEEKLPCTLWQHSSVIAGDSIFLFGGMTGYSGGYVTDIYRGVIEPGTGRILKWEDVGDMPSAFVQDPGAVYDAANGIIYLIGGSSNGFETTEQVWATKVVPLPPAAWAGMGLLAWLSARRIIRHARGTSSPRSTE